MSTRSLASLFCTAAVLFSVPALSQEISRDEYLGLVPLKYPQLQQQTTATQRLHLYGNREDPTYRDADPVDGIDDARHEVLHALAVRFAPFLVQNTTNIPTNFETYIENAPSFPLYVDTWHTSGQHPVLVDTQSVDFSVLGHDACDAARTNGVQGSAVTDAASEDCKLLNLLNQFSPHAPQDAAFEKPLVQKRPEPFTVLFFNFPGEGPGTWEEAYEAEYLRTPEDRRNAFPYSYVHPFIATVENAQGDAAGYELVLQYWFFYPSNDGGNNHEGDWEHLNVLIAPRSLVDEPLSADTIRRILTGDLPATDDARDPLVIRRLDYYFHHLVMTLDFSSPNVYQSREAWKAEVEARQKSHFQEAKIWEAIRYLAYEDHAETVVNTHPLGYIGADNKGLDQALAAPGGKNRNSHGTFPFPGRYHNIGPAGATEQISVHVDARAHWKRLRSGKETMGPRFKRGSVVGLADPERLRIVPDWERVHEFTRHDARARRDWSWLILPIRWGYPATESPFSGILPHADTGNLAPVGPSFSSGWNAMGPAPGFEAYEPHTLPSVFPLGLNDSFRNDLGFFNFTFPVLFNLPPLDFLTRFASYPFKWAFRRGDPVFYPKERVPFRFFGLSSGVSVQVLHDDFDALALNPQQFDEFVGGLFQHLIESGADSTTTVVGGADSRDNSVGPFAQVAFYIGGHFTSENTVRNTRSTFAVSADFNNIPSYHYSAELNYWEYAGSIRYSLSASRLQPFVKGGYGWSWYRVENVQQNGEPFATPESDWIKPKSVWPNVWHLGLGLEFVPWKRVGSFPGGADLAFRVEYARYMESLGLDLSAIPLSRLGLVFPTLGDVPGSERVTRHDFIFGLTLSF